MAIEKNTKNTLSHENGGFTTIINETIHNIKHTGALGLYCYLASQFAGFEICKIHLKNHFQCGIKHIDSCFKILKSLNAIEIRSIRNSKGRIEGWETILKRKINVHYDNSHQNTQNRQSGELSRMPVFHIVDNPDCGKSATINKDTKTKKIIKKNKTTTTTARIFSDLTDERILRIKREAQAYDNVEDEEFLKQCKAHVEARDKTRHNEPQSIAGLCKIIAMGSFAAPAVYVATNQASVRKTENDLAQQYQHYVMRIKADINLKLLPKTTKIMQYEEWANSNVSDRVAKGGKTIK